MVAENDAGASQKKTVSPILAFFSSALLSPVLATSILLAAVVSASLHAVLGVKETIGFAVSNAVVFPLKILAAGVKIGLEFTYFPLNILTGVIGLALAAIPAAIYAAGSVVLGGIVAATAVCVTAAILIGGALDSVASLFAYPVLCARKASQGFEGSLGELLVEDLSTIAKKIKNKIAEYQKNQKDMLEEIQGECELSPSEVQSATNDLTQASTTAVSVSPAASAATVVANTQYLSRNGSEIGRGVTDPGCSHGQFILGQQPQKASPISLVNSPVQYTSPKKMAQVRTIQLQTKQ